MSTNSAVSEDEMLDDPRAQLQADIAERLATLSEQADTPDEFEHVGGAFSASEVDFDTSAWMDRLADVQGWLRFSEQLSDTSPDVFMRNLAIALGFEELRDGIDEPEGLPRLTMAGLGRLFERADQANRIQQIFVEQLQESGSTKIASDAWKEAWDDEPDADDAEPLKPVSATTEVWPIYQFTHKKLNLTPSYQRGDVWTTSARQMLIESVLRGIPLPSVILLRPEQPGLPHEVVDGKQRLTAILRFVGKHPLAVERVRDADIFHSQGGQLRSAFEEDYPTFKKMWKSLRHESLTSKSEDQYFFPFKLGNNETVFNGPLAPLKGKYFSEIGDCVISVADEQITVRDLFESVVAYKIPVIEYKKANQSQIHEVFKLYNKQGVHRNAEESRNAIFHELHLTTATLVAAGDSQVKTIDDVERVAPALVSVWRDVEHLGSTLESYGFGESRYRRTKVLSWMLATLLGDTGTKDLPSTAKHIDDLLRKSKGAFDKIGAVPQLNNTRLNDPAVVGKLFQAVSAATKLHAAYGDELWAPKFKDGDGGQKWQELQLVGSLVGITIAYLSEPESAEGRVEEHAEEMFAESATAERGELASVWARPKKTQTKSQWEFIAKVARRVSEILEADIPSVEHKMRQQFGSSGIGSLFAMIPNDEQ